MENGTMLRRIRYVRLLLIEHGYSTSMGAVPSTVSIINDRARQPSPTNRFSHTINKLLIINFSQDRNNYIVWYGVSSDNPPTVPF